MCAKCDVVYVWCGKHDVIGVVRCGTSMCDKFVQGVVGMRCGKCGVGCVCLVWLFLITVVWIWECMWCV